MLKIVLFCMPLFGLSFSQDIVCPGGKQRCPQDSTCCEMSSGLYGCCPLPNAVCCSDQVHCCPDGYTCDEKEGACLKKMIPKNNAKSMYKTLRSDDNKPNTCPGKEYYCDDPFTTCCNSSGHKQPFFCCPAPNAVCCSDGLHCCPEGEVCDLVAGKCIRIVSNLHKPLLKKQIPAKMTLWKKNHQNMAALISKEKSVICPDGEYACPEGNTCCKLPSGEWGCCPLPEAVCCNDHIHCCPQGTTCNTAKGACDQGYESIPWLKKAPATAVVME